MLKTILLLSCTGTGTSSATSLEDSLTVTAAIVRLNIQMIKRKFSILVTKSHKSLQEREIDIEDVQMFLITMYSSPNSRDGSAMVTTMLESAKSLREIFHALSKYRLWDYLNYYLLQSIIEAFAGDDDELNRMMEDYQKDLTGYVLTQKMQTYLDAMSDSENSADDVSTTSNTDLFKMLTTKCNANVTEHSLRYVNDVRQSLSNQFAIPTTALILHKVSEGCISITWRIPANLDKHVTRMAQETSDIMFAEHHIQKVELEKKCLYQVSCLGHRL